MVKFDVEYFQGRLKKSQDKCYKKVPEIDSTQRKAFNEACGAFQEADTPNAQAKAMKKCLKSGKKILENLDIAGTSASLETKLLVGAMISQATPQGLADWVAKDEGKHSMWMEQFMSSSDMIRFMLTHGGPKDGMWGQAIEIYFDISTIAESAEMEETDPDVIKVSRKIAMACALELAVPVNEFDTKVPVDPIARYNHYVEAYKNGELDPSFPHFSVWELRHVINCDAKNDQLTWGREMIMNYAPYMTTLLDTKLRYNYILDTDVLMRDPHWTSSPRTYQQVLSGGGKDKPNAWFGRFILRAFGIPVWGLTCTQPKKESFARWTPKGWECLRGANFENSIWQGVSGIDFLGEANSRSCYSAEDYYKKMVLLESLAKIMDSRREGSTLNVDESMVHPLFLWRSLAVIQRALLLEETNDDHYERSGNSSIKTAVEKYLEIFELDKDDTEIVNVKGKVLIPAAAHGYSSGNKMVIACLDGGKQLNLMGDAAVEYELPDEIEPGTYTLKMEVCTVHLKQAPMKLTVNDTEDYTIKIPYTEGRWKKTEGVKVALDGGGDLIRFTRQRPCFGIAIRRIGLVKGK